LYFRQNGEIRAVPQLSGAFPGQLRALADIAIQANEAQRKPSPRELAGQSKHWLDGGPMAVNDFRERIVNEFDVGDSRAKKVDAAIRKMDGYDKWRDMQGGGMWVIGLTSDRSVQERRA